MLCAGWPVDGSTGRSVPYPPVLTGSGLRWMERQKERKKMRGREIAKEKEKERMIEHEEAWHTSNN